MGTRHLRVQNKPKSIFKVLLVLYDVHIFHLVAQYFYEIIKSLKLMFFRIKLTFSFGNLCRTPPNNMHWMAWAVSPGIPDTKIFLVALLTFSTSKIKNIVNKKLTDEPRCPVFAHSTPELHVPRMNENCTFKVVSFLNWLSVFGKISLLT